MVHLNCALRGTIRVAATILCYDERDESSIVQRRAGNNARLKNCPVTIDVSLSRGARRIDIAVTLDNRGAGHRLRARFPILEKGSRQFINSVFDLVERTPEAVAGKKNGTTPEVLAARPSAGMIGFQVIDTGEGGVVLAGRGLYEYKHHHDTGYVDLTLFRSAGSINFGFEAWATAEGGYMPGRWRMEYAFEPYNGHLFSGGALSGIDNFLTPPLLVQYPWNTAVQQIGFQLDDERLMFSAFSQCEDGGGFIFRFFNRSEEVVTRTIELGNTFETIAKCRMDETHSMSLARKTSRVELKILPKEVVTLLLK